VTEAKGIAVSPAATRFVASATAKPTNAIRPANKVATRIVVDNDGIGIAMQRRP
jgi:hypothetical protein